MNPSIRRKCLLGFTCLISLNVLAQAPDSKKTSYIPPSDPKVQEKLANWQDLKFGLFMHWGTYSQWGVVESWSICPEDEDWTQRKGPYGATYDGYKKAYENLQTTFNPVNFNPEKWVKAAKAAGMKYVVFTTKHHDGFAMFDTKQSDYKITDPKTPFSKNPRANVAKEIFSAFRKDNFLIGAYFSKPDWHSPYYWWPYFPPKDRNVNYDPAKYPERWQQFKDYTFNQIQELMTGYGSIDILWLDGGWVKPYKPQPDSNGPKRYDQDIDMPRIAKMARQHQPGLIVVDREVPGEFENYTTPEQQVPEAPLDHPWETCMTMGNSWSYVPGDHYKSVAQLVQLLVKVVSRGGNFLMNIGPGPDGDWDPEAYKRLEGIGQWMKINGEAIYGSRPVAPYSDGNTFFTQNKNGSVVYAIYLATGDKLAIPAQLHVSLQQGARVKSLSLLGVAAKLKWKQDNTGVSITIPGSLQNASGLQNAAVFKLALK